MSDIKKAQRSDVSLDRIIRDLSNLELGVSNRLWIAFSGGVDSTVLLNAAAKTYAPRQLAVVHVNHQLSRNADSWESHCERVTSKLDLEFCARTVSLCGKNLEYAGRRARTSVFADVMRAGDVLATAHHQDDELESLAWQLATGRALVGIAAWRHLGHGRLWRPLLSYRREELRQLAVRFGWSWIEDESNRDNRFTRNALRHHVLPRLKKRFLDFEASLLAAKEPPLEQLAREPIEAKTLENNPKRLRAWLHAFSITPRNSVVKEIMRQANARRDAQILVRVSPHACVRRHRGLLFVVMDAASSRNLCVRVGEDVSFAFGKLEWVQRHIGLPRDAEFHIELRQGGETIAVENQSIKLSKWFYTKDVPQWERDAWPLLYQGERLIAVPGLGIDSSACITDGYVPNWRRTGSNC